jgi:hypothetical protein
MVKTRLQYLSKAVSITSKAVMSWELLLSQSEVSALSGILEQFL